MKTSWVRRCRPVLLKALEAAAVAAGLAFALAASASPPASTPAPQTSSVKKSIRGWISCGAAADQTAGVAQAFAAARHAAFSLVVDCPVRLHIGTDIDRTLYIDDGTTIEFTSAGKFVVDNVFHPAFVIANSKDIVLTDWNVEYDAGLPVDWNVGGYRRGGQFRALPAGYAQPASAFNNEGITPWLTANRGVVFDRSPGQGNATSFWVGPTNTSAVFFITGDTSNVRVTGMHLSVPRSAGVERFIPMAFSLTLNYKSNQTVTKSTPLAARFVAIPHDLVFSNIDLDGTYMGWTGGVRDVLFEHIRSHRYGDLQDAKGENVGGVHKWFAPPHLFYLGYAPNGDPELFNRNIRIEDVVDDGPRVGVARDRGGGDTVSGYALSLKLGCVDCRVDGYKSSRPDGFMDVLPSDGLTVSNVDASFDSAFTNNVFPGWRFPSAPYKRLTFENITLRDLAAASIQPPIGGASSPANEKIVFRNVKVTINAWAGKGALAPQFGGQDNDVALEYFMTGDKSRLASAQRGALDLTLQALPSIVRPGGVSALSWVARNAAGCSASGAWSGDLAPGSGRRDVKPGLAGGDFTANCHNGTDAAAATLHLSDDH